MTYFLDFAFGVFLGAALMWLHCVNTEVEWFIELWDRLDERMQERMQERIRARRGSEAETRAVRRVSEAGLELVCSAEREELY